MELKLEVGSISNDGTLLTINETSDWTESDQGTRDRYGVFVFGELYTGPDPVRANVSPSYQSNDSTAYTASVTADGRYVFKAYAWYNLWLGPTFEEGDYRVDGNHNLTQYIGGEFVGVDPQSPEAIAAAVYTTTVDLEVPYLGNSYTFKNQLNLEYIKQVKSDIAEGIDQNMLYYERTDLDYYSALLNGAGYNFSLGLLSNFYAIVENLNDIRVNKQIS